jgi:hypothetical protein
MTEEEKIYTATKAFDKGWGYETTMYSDDMYENKNDMDDVWEYVLEIQDFGRIAFYEKYKNIQLY